MADIHTSTGADWARFKPGATPGITLMQAHFTEHAFERHSHDTYSIGVTASGVQTFHCRGEHHASRRGDVILFNPDEPHDGRRGTDEGFAYSILYVDPVLVHDWLDKSAGTLASKYFQCPVAHDPAAGCALAQALNAVGQAQESLRAEELTSEVVVRLLQRYGETPSEGQAAIPGWASMARVRDYLEAHYADDLTVDALARQAGLSRVHLTRAFTRQFGVPPHVYLNSVRLQRARQALLAGQSLIDTAAATGFADQSHFNKRFKGSMGVAPGAWLQQMRAHRP